MNRCFVLSIFSVMFFMTMANSYAAGIIARVQQMKAMRQQQSQGVAVGENEEQNQQPSGPQAPAPLTYQQQVDQRNQAIAAAILDTPNTTVTSENLKVDGVQVPPKPVAVQAPTADVQEVVDLSEVWKKLDKRSTVWNILIDDKDKVLTVSEFIDRFHQQGVKINQPPLHYVQMIDQIATQNPDILQKPFGELLQIMAIVEYDFDNGMNKDDLARKVLGEAGFEANKKRFSQ